ncbi:FAD binding domain protein [Xylariales sp. PMI_506]|nr:FAD binding domain protein [Xylariales sp. PMI_506]
MSAKPLSPYPLAEVPSEKLPTHIQSLLAELPGCVILQSDTEGFQSVLDSYFVQQSREVIPACVVRPHNVQQLSTAVGILKRQYDSRVQAGSKDTGLFAIRSGGVNPGIGASTLQDGVVIDLRLLNDVAPADDGSTVTVGTGARWIDLYKKLDEKGIVAIGGRNSPVGIGGLALQGGISFYSPRNGFVCSNVTSYEVVLADGSVVTASASEHPDLWRVLKGGSNNFGIVTRFTLRCVPAEPIWAGGIVSPATEFEKAQEAFHDYIKHASSGEPGAFDENAAGPMLTLVYVQQMGLSMVSSHLVYTKAPEDGNWPAHWKNTGFASLSIMADQIAVRSHTSAVEQLAEAVLPGNRFIQYTTTIRNDIGTLKAAHAIADQALATLREVKGLIFPFNLQVVLPGWMNKGDPNILGLDGCTEALIIILFSVTWDEAKDDDLVRSTTRRAIEQIDEEAAARKSGHPYRFMNYCAEWQRPYDGAGEENLRRLRDASRKYDPDGLFQRGCTGGHKLDIEYDKP